MKSGYGASMFRKGFFLLCLLVTSLMTATVLHAQEFAGQPQLECSGEVHAQQNGQPSSGDAEKAMTQHHGCHSVSSFLNAAHAAQQMPMPATNIYVLPRADALVSLRVGPGLRPPIA